MPRYSTTSSSKGSHILYHTFHVLTQLLVCQLGGLGNALQLQTETGMLGHDYTKLTSSKPRNYFLTANLGDYCLYHNQSSILSIKATSAKAATPSSLPKEDILPRCQTPAEAPKCQT
ncbi:hypothetical protein L3X38_009356 [Prunus dulcis]|uniref:Uncharacterized protein n=1 Tax=Prunus dulcis TaxID=3755 RepID=A0AAD4ZYL1_PRUDU|nr:hypothetical protein L3X38_009356 [Prunus dulcis]